ncbi:L,D-transpeptidase family protein [Streptomyces sp. OF3]|uniref:L,D-transpeptidase family protein n=1 Tax=Streptomyces alkaliterrae TaxID=2213162 RepID=A0A7W3ZL10_9ACTN|nr:L,D-transpeptidase family protein [Streptomyces alkaliterrae]MBB1252253.1 L,D-transpeptidase family protein [Streptomyces alkaliterrae]
MRLRSRALSTMCGAIAVLALTVGCEGVTVDTSGAGEPSRAAAGVDGADDTGKNGDKDPRAATSQPPADPKEPAGAREPEAVPSTPTTPDPATSAPGSATPSPTTTRPAIDTRGPAPLLVEGSEGRHVREVQARLQQLGLLQRNPSGYYGTLTSGSVREFQKQRALAQTGTTTPETWRSLRDRTTTPTAAQLNPQTSYPIADPDKRCTTGRVLCISKESRTLAWMIDGKVMAAMDVRFGSQYTPTREGTFKVDFKSRDHHSTLYDTPMPFAMFFSGGQAVHYSADFAAVGYNGASHGCVNVRDREKIAKVFDEVRAGDKVIVYS